MALSDDDYRPPAVPFEGAPPDAFPASPHHQDDFMLDRDTWTFLNHGAFGAALFCGHVRAHQWRQFLEQQPLRYFDRHLLPHLVYAARRLAQFTHATSPESIVLAQNATSLLNSVIAGYVRTCREHNEEQQPCVVLWDTSYGSVKKMAHGYGATVLEIPFQEQYLWRLADHDTEHVFLDALHETLDDRSDDLTFDNALLILDHTTSNTALTVPIEVLARSAKERYNMLVLVDGAHGLLAQDVRLNEYDPYVDVYVSNGHKWLSCPRGVAMMHCAKEELRESLLRQPVVISHGIDDGYFSRFVWDGTRDYAAKLALPVVLDYWDKQDPNKVRHAIRTRLAAAIEVLADLWHGGCPQESWPGRVTIAPFRSLSPMALVRLPEHVCGHAERNPKTSTNAKQVQDSLYDQRIEAPIKAINGVLYVRLSCHVYNELQEYERLGKVMLTLSK